MDLHSLDTTICDILRSAKGEVRDVIGRPLTVMVEDTETPNPLLPAKMLSYTNTWMSGTIATWDVNTGQLYVRPDLGTHWSQSLKDHVTRHRIIEELTILQDDYFDKPAGHGNMGYLNALKMHRFGR